MTSFFETLRNAPWKKYAKRAAFAAAVFLALFMVASNVMLRTRAFRNLMAFDPESMTMDYASAYSWFPGRIHVEGLTLRGSDSHVQWFLTVDSADTFMNPFAFAARRFSASHASAHGITFHMRTRFEPEHATPERMAALPEIPGFPDPPMVMPVPPDPSDHDYVLWSVDLEDVHAEDVRDVWIDGVRVTGQAAMRGRWSFRPLRELDFGPSTIEIARFDVTDRGLAVARSATGTIDARIWPYDVRAPHGLDVLHQVSTDARLSLTLPIGEGLDRMLGPEAVKLAGGEVDVAGEVVIDRGVLAPRTKARVDIDDARIESREKGSFSAETDAIVRADVDETRTFAATATTTRLVLAKRGTDGAAAREVGAIVTSRHLDLAHGFDDAHLQLAVHDATTRSLERWAGGDGSSWATGSLVADADVETDLADPDFSGRVDATVKDATVALAGTRVTSDLSVTANVTHASPSKKRLAATLHAQTPEPILTVLGDLRLRSLVAAGGHVDATLGELPAVALDDAEVKWTNATADYNGAPLFVAPEIAIRSKKASFAHGALAGEVTLDAPRLDFATLASLARLAPFPESTKIVGGTATANAHASVDLSSENAKGSVDVLARDVDVRIDETALFGNVQIGARATRRQDGVTDLSGTTLVFARGTAPHAPRAAEPWSGTFTLTDATLHSRLYPWFHAVARGVATDASPATAFLSASTGVPQWITDAFRMRNLSVGADIMAGPEFFFVRALDARGEGSFVQLEYSRRKTMKDGAVYLGTGILRGGIDLAGGGARLVIFGPEAWFQKDVAKIRANETSLPR